MTGADRVDFVRIEQTAAVFMELDVNELGLASYTG
jgi:hypothetical protein